mmetsp:Transcript_541/g.629  ORF Transcript_541/g.629 Transcript_541/m.629 type:complete len:208 (-) Transcript_541:340-963(-)|eukprot:CAMPEP_0197848126 /NCGR_PEP_ID=MMETSP1438-20131217/7940_1 /TAXON_ID=1461541 /ORGANISM="Pterosperma sp., Strain CCMP1384" /LENGTH=207 /DNA_ID=CAMNT_0043460261 /DNA_START=213 /DNA_END=836 /DNA_ORIENTATION=-
MQTGVRLFQQARARLASVPSVRSLSTSNFRRGIEDFFETSPDYKFGEKPLYGHAWTAEMLRTKSFEDIHKLWYVLLKEQNKLASEKYQLKVQGTPEPPCQGERLSMVKKSMIRVKTVLTERATATAEDKIQLTAMKQLINGPGPGKTAYLTVPDYREQLEKEMVKDVRKRLPRESYEVFPKTYRDKKKRRNQSARKLPFRSRKHKIK